MKLAPLLLIIPVLFMGSKAKATQKSQAWKRNIKFEQDFIDASRHWGIPEDLLARVAYQESRFRDDIISGKTVSHANAQGIMQIVPRWHPDVDPLNPTDAIWYAAKYLSSLYNRFGNWKHALAAYNWGQGNLAKYLSGTYKNMPKETANYISQITKDVTV